MLPIAARKIFWNNIINYWQPFIYLFIYLFFDDDVLIVFKWNFRFIWDSHPDGLSVVLYKYFAFS